jgi:hypothetical protein
MDARRPPGRPGPGGLPKGGGNDILFAGPGVDVLSGGVGADTFKVLARNTGVDLLLDFNIRDGDRIDLSAINANALEKGNQAFEFIGEGGFTAPGQVRIDAGGHLQFYTGGYLPRIILVGVSWSADHPGFLSGSTFDGIQPWMTERFGDYLIL